MRTLPAQVIDLLEAGRITIRNLLLINLPSGDSGVWNDTYSLTFSGVVYAPLAGNMTVSEIPASTNLDVDRVTVTITNLQNAATQALASEQWHQRSCTLFMAFLDDAGSVIHAEPRFSGFLDTLTITDAADDTTTMAFSIESNARELSRAAGGTRSDASQRLRSATDGIYKYAASAASDAQINWGRKGPHFPSRAVRR